MKAAFRSHPYLVSAFALALAALVFFAVNVVSDAIYWSSHEREAVSPWMTVGYVAKSWDLHGPDIDVLAGLPGPDDGGPKTLNQIAAERGVPVADIIADVETAIAELNAAREARHQADHAND